MGFATAIAIAAVAASAAGSVTQFSASQEAAEANSAIAEQERLANEERRKAMELDARRKRLEIIREQQRARALAVSNATVQGAESGSGLPGAYGQISGATGVNLLGVSQNLEIGRNLFAINDEISNQRINVAQAQGQAAFGQGLSSLGASLYSSMGAFNRLSGGFGAPSNNSNPYGNPTVYGSIY